MQVTKGFWPALERVPGLSDVPAAWRNEFGSDFECAQRFLRPRGGLAESYPRLDGQPWGPVYRVVSHSEHAHVGICDESGDRIELTTPDITLHEVDRGLLATAVAGALGLEPMIAPTDLRTTTRLGTLALGPGCPCPVYLTIALEPRAFRTAVDRLCASEDGPFLLLTPTRQRTLPDAEQALRNKGAACLALSDCLHLSGDGQLQANEAAKPLLDDFRRQAISVRKPAAVGDPFEFRLHGGLWKLTFSGKTAFLPDLSGFHCLAKLIAKAFQSIDAIELTRVIDAGLEKRESVVNDDRTDAQAMTAYKERLAELQEEIDEAKEFGNVARHEELCEQQAALLNEVAAATALGGRRRKVGQADRPRSRVKMAISRAFEHLRAKHPELERHLQQSVQTGRHCCYAPASAVPWLV